MQRPQTVTKTLANILKTLTSSGYVQASSNSISDVENLSLLENGQLLSNLLLQQWCQKSTTIPSQQVADVGRACHDSNSRTAFLASAQFRHHLHCIRTQTPSVIPSACKVQLRSALLPTEAFLPFIPSFRGTTYLVTDYFYPASLGLEKFYSTQRERKIWWMRLSANPSRYCVDPYDLTENADEFTDVSKSVTIKSELPYGMANMEQITCVELENTAFKLNEDYSLRDARDHRVMPAVIRSVIDLQAAACAMLFDASDHKRGDSLLLNRKLVPFQCSIVTLHKDNLSEDLMDLTKHLHFVLKEAGIRVFGNSETFISNEANLQNVCMEADTIGLPYMLLIDPDTLRQGLLKLRSRDTTLEETIHISDIPGYLLNIFKC